MASALFKVGRFELSRRHLIIIGILVAAFTISFMIRMQPMMYGYELNEFDPYFNYRATEYLFENGLHMYNEWRDYKAWYPEGRDVSATSQNMLHFTAAATYGLFGGSTSLLDFIIILPVIFGSLTCIAVFALVRVMGGTTAGLMAAILYSVSLPIMVRGMMGWFKSEPIGLFYGIIGVYLFLSGIKSNNHKTACIKIIGSGICIAMSLSAWGGMQFLVLPLGMFILVLPFLRNDYKFQLWALPLFTVATLATVSVFERPGISFILGVGGMALVGPTVISIVCNLVQAKSREAVRLRNGLVTLGGTFAVAIVALVVGTSVSLISLPAFRYLNAINPFLTTADPLVDSVAEHATTTLANSFHFHSVLMVLAAFGIWAILRSRDFKYGKDMIAFALLNGLMGVYISSAFIRLEVFASLAVIILGSMGFSVLVSKIFIVQKSKLPSSPIPKMAMLAGVLVLLVTPLTIPAYGNWVNSLQSPPTILNGGTNFAGSYSDWKETFEWIRNNTPEDAVIASWWDYGYWITTNTNRATLADNATINTTRIAEVGLMLISEPDTSWEMLQKFDADYVLVFTVAQKAVDDPEMPLYQLQGGGDESKKHWFIAIPGQPVEKYIHADGMSGTDYFWESTLLGQIFPYTPVLYYDPNTSLQYPDYLPGTIPLYAPTIKYATDGDGPLKLAYSSESYNRNDTLAFGIFIYEVNQDYVPAS